MNDQSFYGFPKQLRRLPVQIWLLVGLLGRSDSRRCRIADRLALSSCGHVTKTLKRTRTATITQVKLVQGHRRMQQIQNEASTAVLEPKLTVGDSEPEGEYTVANDGLRSLETRQSKLCALCPKGVQVAAASTKFPANVKPVACCPNRKTITKTSVVVATSVKVILKTVKKTTVRKTVARKTTTSPISPPPPPPPVFVSSVPPPVFTNFVDYYDGSFDVIGTGIPLADVNIFVDGEHAHTGKVGLDGTFLCIVQFRDGTHIVTASQKDFFTGETSNLSDPYTLDVVPPPEDQPMRRIRKAAA